MFDAAVAAGADPFAATAANSDLIASLTDTSNAVGNDSAFYILANWIIWTVFSVIELVVRLIYPKFFFLRHNIDAI